MLSGANGIANLRIKGFAPVGAELFSYDGQYPIGACNRWKIVSMNLRLLKRNLQNLEAREAMCFASMIMGMNLANVGTCLPYRIPYAVGIEIDTNHGARLPALYPAWLVNEYEEGREKIVKVMEWMGFPSVKCALDVKESIQVFLNELELNYSLSGLGIEKGMLPVLADAVTGNLANDSLTKRAGIVELLLKQASKN